jgi:hypothetical protein
VNIEIVKITGQAGEIISISSIEMKLPIGCIIALIYEGLSFEWSRPSIRVRRLAFPFLLSQSVFLPAGNSVRKENQP